MTTKGKNRQVGLYQDKNFLHSKENNQENEKTTYEMGKFFQTIYQMRRQNSIVK